MGVEWRLQKVDPFTKEPVGGEEPFDPGCFDMREIDIILVGKYEGPISGLLTDPGDDGEGEGDEEFDPDSEALSIAIIPPEEVRRCAERLAAIPRDRFTPLGTVVEQCFHTFSPGDEIPWYDDLVETTKSLQKLIEDAAARGDALGYWIEGV